VGEYQARAPVQTRAPPCRGLFCSFVRGWAPASPRATEAPGPEPCVFRAQIERLWRDSKLLEIGGGTNEAHHKNIARDLTRVGTTVLP
jgi:alkylation response protein AidB-like acyl-CoA dehydrogenase